jgi:PAS domain-containing protein
MLNLKSVIGKIIIPPVFADDEKTRVARHLNSILWGTITVMTLVEIAMIIILPENIVRSLMNIVVVDGSCIVYLWLTRCGYTRLASIFFVLETWVLATVLAFTAGGMHAPYGVVYIAIIFVVGLLLGERAGIGAGVVCCLTGLMFIWAERSGHLPVSVMHHTEISLWVIYAFSMAAIIALQYVSARAVKDSLKQARHELTARKQTEEALNIKDHAIFSAINGMAITDMEGKLTYVNPSFLTLWGYENEHEILGKPIIAFW